MSTAAIAQHGRLHAQGAGKRYGLTFVIDIQEEETVFLSRPDILNLGAGLNVIIHDPHT